MKKDEAIESAVEQLSRPNVYLRVTLASSPEAAKVICSRLPGVKELIQIGSDAASPALHFLHPDDESLRGDSLSTIGLFLLHHIITPETMRVLAESVVNDKFHGINRDLAASAFLKSTGEAALDMNDEEKQLLARAKQRACEALGYDTAQN